MEHSRRDFILKTVLLGTAVLNSNVNASSTLLQNNTRTSIRKLPILQGATSETSTQINVLSDEKISFHLEPYYPTLKIDKIEKHFSKWVSYRLFINDLVANEIYTLIIKDENENVIDQRQFSSLKSTPASIKIALASCMRDISDIDHQTGMWDSLQASEPDLLFLLGDNVYVDDGPSRHEEITPEKIWRRYVETRCTLGLYQFSTLIPTLATWDDHDFGKNNTYGHTEWVEASKEIFRILYAQDPIMPEVSWGPGIATSFSAYGQRFYLMDDRSFRQTRWIGKTHWGYDQEDWLFNSLGKNQNPSWIFNGSQFFGAYRTGWSYEGNHPKSFKKILEKLKKTKVPVLFGSGDVHYSEVMKIEPECLGYETLEITSSSMHSNAKSPRSGNKRRLQSTGEFNFVIAEVEPVPTGLNLQLKAIGQKSKELFSLKNFEVKNS